MTLLSYPAALTLHVLAVAVFLSGLILAALLLPGLARNAGAPERWTELLRLHRWNRVVTTPALLLVWFAGLTLADEGGWFASGWLQAKLLFVLALSALHGIQSARLRRLIRGEPLRSRPTMRPALFILIAAIAILILVTAKPW